MNAPNDNPGAADTTDFGYQQVPKAEKAARVRAVFESVAGNYDLMNDLMSGGAHRIWKRFTLSQTGLRPGQRAVETEVGAVRARRESQRLVERDRGRDIANVDRHVMHTHGLHHAILLPATTVGASQTHS